jgi:hypothetical protein
LDLSYNQAIGIQGFSALGKLLKVNKSLESLNLARYWHSSGGLFCDKSFIEPLKENTTLEFLNLNEIICDSKCIAEMLKFNKTLKSLKVSRSADSAIRIIEALKNNSSLSVIEMSCHAEETQRFWEVIGVNHSLKELCLWCEKWIQR